ncbi:MAG: 4Fe-4S binding protein [Synergistaceae bacterium]|nr:4Fe-4S binding protein [Synergistaceae bacterium]
MRKIIRIDEEKCDGCGLCAEACHEGAIVVENGKAKLVSESYCDGLGDCIGECPRGAISFEMREAAAYDEAAVKERMAAGKKDPCNGTLPCGCPGTMAKELKSNKPSQKEEKVSLTQESELCNWPVQLSLVPVQAPYLKDAGLLLAADCTAFACPNFHRDLLPGKVCLVGCPKLDEVEPYIEKLAEIIKLNGIKEIDVAYMEVPCCGGLVKLADAAVKRAAASVTLKLIKLSLAGKFLEVRQIFPQ